MKHRISGNKLSRNSTLRKATVRDIAKAILIHQRVCTTQAKAKEARKLVDRLITLGKKGLLAHKRKAFSILCDHGIVKNLFDQIAPRFKSRLGGYSRIILAGQRNGDNATLVYLELTEKDHAIVSKSSALTRTKEKEIKDQESAASHKDKKQEPSSEHKPEKPQPGSDPKHPSKHPTKGSIDPNAKKNFGGFGKIFRRKTEE